MNYFTLYNFTGIEQHADGSLLPSGSACEANGVDTIGGNLETHQAPVTMPFGEMEILVTEGGASTVSRLDKLRTFLVFPDGAAGLTDVSFRQLIAVATSVSSNTAVTPTAYTSKMYAILLKSDLTPASASTEISYNWTQVGADITGELDVFSSIKTTMLFDGAVKEVIIFATSLGLKAMTYTPTAPNEMVAALSGFGSSETGVDTKVKWIAEYSGRLFAANGGTGTQNRLYWSAVEGDGRTWENWLLVDGSADASGGYVDIGDRGDEITGLYALTNELLVFKRFSLWRVRGDRPSNFTVERVCSYNQNPYQNSIVENGGIPYWLTREGVMYYNGSSAIPAGTSARKIQKLAKQIRGVRAWTQSVAADNVLYFSVGITKPQGVVTALIAYDVMRDAFMVYEYPHRDLAEIGGVVFLCENDRISLFNRGEFTTAWQGCKWVSQLTDLGAKYWKKQVKEVLFRASGGDIKVTVKCGNTVVERVVQVPQDNDGLVRIPVPSAVGSAIQITLESVDDSLWTIYGGIDIGYEKEAI